MIATNALYSIRITDLLKETARRKYRINRETTSHFCPPGAGHWGMVKMAFRVPEVAVVFVIPMGCGRHGGVSAMKEGLEGSLSYLPIAEVDIVTGDHLRKTEEALSVLIEDEHPKAIMLFTTCIDDLLGSDYESIFFRLEDCYGIPIRRARMNPLMSLSTKPPEMMIYNSMHSFLEKTSLTKGLYNVIGTPMPIDHESEIHEIFKDCGLKPLQHIGNYKSFEEHFEMSRAEGNLLIALPGLRAVEDMERRLGQSFVSIFGLFRPEGITANYNILSEYLGISINTEPYKTELEQYIESNKMFFEGKTAVIGTTLQAAPFELARFLTEMGMVVKYITAGMIKPYEREHIPWLEENAPHLRIIPSVDPSLSSVKEPEDQVDYGFGLDTPAYFDVKHLIDISVDDNLFGYVGTRKLIDLVVNAPEYNLSIKELVYSQNLVV
jgi:nitrogenase molybdenum-cofactor synthesis protein NifE